MFSQVQWIYFQNTVHFTYRYRLYLSGTKKIYTAISELTASLRFTESPNHEWAVECAASLCSRLHRWNIAAIPFNPPSFLIAINCSTISESIVAQILRWFDHFEVYWINMLRKCNVFSIEIGSLMITSSLPRRTNIRQFSLQYISRFLCWAFWTLTRSTEPWRTIILLYFGLTVRTPSRSVS